MLPNTTLQTVKGDKFYKGLTLSIKDKLASVAHLYKNINFISSLHVIKLDEAYLAHQKEILVGKQ